MSSLKWDNLQRITEECNSESFYCLDLDRYQSNVLSFLNAFKKNYGNTKLGYSYKTNYIPAICKIADKNGCYAEVVSRMEYDIALNIGVEPSNIIFNGPYKKYADIEYALRNGSVLNLDSHYEVEYLLQISSLNPSQIFNIGLRCYFDIETGVQSRFGFDAEDGTIQRVFERLQSVDNINVVGLHCHFSTGSRDLDSFRTRTRKLLQLSKNLPFNKLEYIDIGGGFFGRMPDQLKKLFEVKIPTFNEYADVVTSEVSSFYPEENVVLILEPGAAVVADTMTFFAKIVDIKRLDNRFIALSAGSIHNIKPTGNTKNLPMEIILSKEDNAINYSSIDVAGYTCMEHDYLYRGFSGKLSVGSFIKFSNMGAYTIVFTPPFIKGAPPIIGFQDGIDKICIYRNQQEAFDVLATFNY
jgi:diaminopimelate decarboxylase